MSIHPTAIIDPRAKLASDIEVGPYVVIDGPAEIGPGCRLQPHSRVSGRTLMGARNVLHSFAVVGDTPQDRKFHDEPSTTIIGDDNIFREGVTIHRGTGENTVTKIGSRCFFMCNSHVGHNCTVEDDVILVNGALLGGHVSVGTRTIISGNCGLHQFVRVGKLAMISNASTHNQDIPPFCTAMFYDQINSLNFVGMRRAGYSRQDISAMRFLFRVLCHRTTTLAHTLEQLPAEIKAAVTVQEFTAFCQHSERGIADFVTISQSRGAGYTAEST